MKILVTGANGQLGEEIRLLSNHFPFDFIFHDIDTLDITNSNELFNFFENTPIDYIVNCAAYTAVDKAEDDEKIASLINHVAVRDMFFLAREKHIKIIHISTDYVFDGTHHLPYKETDSPRPNSTYGFTKLKGEAELMNYDKAIIIRTSWLYSSFGNNFVKTIMRLASERNELGIIFDQVGTPTYAHDLADTILTIIKKVEAGEKPFTPGIYHYSNEGVASWYDFAKEIVSIKELNCHVKPIETKDYPTKATRPHYSVLNKSKIKATYQIEIPYWKDSLIECLQKL